MVKRGTTNEHLKQLMVFLEKSAKKHKASIWQRLAYLLSRPTRQRAEVNLYRLNASKSTTLAVPGKVLSTGNLNHKVTVAAWSFSSVAKKKIDAAGGKALSLRELVTSHPTGKGVTIII